MRSSSSIALFGIFAVAALLASADAASAQLDHRPVGPVVAESPSHGSERSNVGVRTAAAPAVCPLGPARSAGTLQLSRSAYVTDGSAGTSFVLLTRTGGTEGAVSASVITSDASAEAGSDYTAVSTTVRFDDGDRSARLVAIPILENDLVEGDEAFDVSLLDPNCVAFGDQTTAEVTIGGVLDGGSFALARALP